MKDRIILHVDMDAFFASVEMRDNPTLKNKPLIIGVMPNERGVVSTCNYEARKYGVHSAMNIKDAYRLCPHGVYMRTNIDKYRAVSNQLHDIWKEYCEVYEPIAFDEAYLDITKTIKTYERAREVAVEIKQRTLDTLGLTCSIGVAYSKSAAKIASEEKKPNGYFEIHNREEFRNIILDRDIRIINSVGRKTEERLKKIGINTARDIEENKESVIKLLGNHGLLLVKIVSGIDERKVEPYNPEDAKSISREITFQKNVADYELLKDMLLVLAVTIVNKAKHLKLDGHGVVLKLTYTDMKSITRSKAMVNCNDTYQVYVEAVKLLEATKQSPIRLLGLGLNNVEKQNSDWKQLTFEGIFDNESDDTNEKLIKALVDLGDKYKLDFLHNTDKFYKSGILHKTAEYMRKYRLNNNRV